MSEDDPPTVVVDINRYGDEVHSALSSVEEVERWKKKLMARIRSRECKDNHRNVLKYCLLNSWFLFCILPCASGFTITFLLNLSWLYLAVALVACPIVMFVVMFVTFGFLARINLISPFWCGSMGMQYLIVILIMCDIGMVAAVIVNRIFLGG